MSAEAVPDFLNAAAASVMDYEPCKWYGCPNDVYYAFGPGAGYCQEHGLEKIRANQASGVAVMRQRRAAAPPPLLPLAKEVLVAARELDKASLAARKAEERRAEAAGELRLRLRDLITALADQAPAAA